MKKITLASILSLFLLAACASGTSEKEVVVNYPDDWVADTDYLPGSDDSTVYHFADDSFEDHSRGFIIHAVVENPDNKDLQTIFDESYELCLENNPEPENVDEILFIPCLRRDLTEFTVISIDGVTAYRSDIHGIPESGEEAENIYIPFDDKYVLLRAGYISYDPAVRAEQKKIVDGIFDSLEIK